MMNEVSSLDEANGWYMCMHGYFIHYRMPISLVYISFGVTPISIFAQHINNTTILIIRHKDYNTHL